MTLKATRKGYAILALMGILYAGHVSAQEGKIQATVFLIGIQQPLVIPDFTVNDERFYDAIQEGKQVKLPFRDLKEITFLNPGNTFETEILFNDGRKGTYSLQPAADITLSQGGGEIMMSHIKVARVQFSPRPAQPPPPQRDAQTAQRQPQPNIAPAAIDRVVLHSGDSLSGHLQTKTFPLRTAYGTFQLEAPKIASIDFDTTRPNTAVVLLKNGDRLSGTVEVESVRFTMIVRGSGQLRRQNDKKNRLQEVATCPFPMHPPLRRPGNLPFPSGGPGRSSCAPSSSPAPAV